MMIPEVVAQGVCDAALEKAKAMDFAVCVAVMDTGGHLKVFRRMDGAWLAASDIALKKAKTAILFGFETQLLQPQVGPGGPAEGAELSNDILIHFAGGIPLKDAFGALQGSIGVSGGLVEQDYAVAQAGAARFAELTSSRRDDPS